MVLFTVLYQIAMKKCGFSFGVMLLVLLSAGAQVLVAQVAIDVKTEWG